MLVQNFTKLSAAILELSWYRTQSFNDVEKNTAVASAITRFFLKKANPLGLGFFGVTPGFLKAQFYALLGFQVIRMSKDTIHIK